MQLFLFFLRIRSLLGITLRSRHRNITSIKLSSDNTSK